MRKSARRVAACGQTRRAGKHTRVCVFRRGGCVEFCACVQCACEPQEQHPRGRARYDSSLLVDRRTFPNSLSSVTYCTYVMRTVGARAVCAVCVCRISSPFAFVAGRCGSQLVPGCRDGVPACPSSTLQPSCPSNTLLALFCSLPRSAQPRSVCAAAPRRENLQTSSRAARQRAK